MATEEKQPEVIVKATEEKVVEKTQQFWSKNSKLITGVILAAIILVGGYFAYDTYFKAPAELEANEAIWPSEKAYRTDSFQLALNGDGTKNNIGLLKVISKHGNTKAGNLAHFYAGICYLQTGDFNNAVKHLEEYSPKDPESKLRALGSLGDAYAELGKNELAVTNYKKATEAFVTDEANTSEYLFRLGQLYDKMGKSKEAIEAFTSLKEKFPLSLRIGETDKYLAKLGETK
jgi:predicted negative regulator of RcsB-dependent stress response